MLSHEIIISHQLYGKMPSVCRISYVIYILFCLNDIRRGNGGKIVNILKVKRIFTLPDLPDGMSSQMSYRTNGNKQLDFLFLFWFCFVRFVIFVVFLLSQQSVASDISAIGCIVFLQIHSIKMCRVPVGNRYILRGEWVLTSDQNWS